MRLVMSTVGVPLESPTPSRASNIAKIGSGLLLDMELAFMSRTTDAPTIPVNIRVKATAAAVDGRRLFAIRKRPTPRPLVLAI